ncbi:MAG: TPM domain-containing protein [Bacteroidota bacterium]
MPRAKDFFTKEQQDRIVAAVKEAEMNTSGEIRVFIEDKCIENVLDRAAFIFEQLEIHKTKERNGVLFYLAVSHRKFAILGDAGINSKVKPDFWDEIKHTMVSHFKLQDFATGMSKGILMAGKALQEYFPHQADDVNELPDEIVFGK